MTCRRKCPLIAFGAKHLTEMSTISDDDTIWVDPVFYAPTLFKDSFGEVTYVAEGLEQNMVKYLEPGLKFFDDCAIDKEA